MSAQQLVSVRKQVASFYFGWEEEQRSGVGGMASRNKTNWSLFAVRAGHPGLVAQGAGGSPWLARMTSLHPGTAAVRWRSAEWWEIMKHTGVGNVDQTWRCPRKKGRRAPRTLWSWLTGSDGAPRLGCGWPVLQAKDNRLSRTLRRWGGPKQGKITPPAPTIDDDLL